MSWTSSRCGWLEVSITYWSQCILGTRRSTLIHPGEKCKSRRRPGANDALCNHTEKCECAVSRDEAGCAEGAAAAIGRKKWNFDSLIYTKMQIFAPVDDWICRERPETCRRHQQNNRNMKQRGPFTVEAVIVVYSVHSPTIMFYLCCITIDNYGATSAGTISKTEHFSFCRSDGASCVFLLLWGPMCFDEWFSLTTS